MSLNMKLQGLARLIQAQLSLLVLHQKAIKGLQRGLQHTRLDTASLGWLAHTRGLKPTLQIRRITCDRPPALGNPKVFQIS
jgi:hypothetical protein